MDQTAGVLSNFRDLTPDFKSCISTQVQNKTQGGTADGEVTTPFAVFLFNTATAELWRAKTINNKIIERSIFLWSLYNRFKLAAKT